MCLVQQGFSSRYSSYLHTLHEPTRIGAGGRDLSGEAAWIKTSFVFPEGDGDKAARRWMDVWSERAAPQIDAVLT